MWGREARAALVFVLISVVAGGAFRGWQRAHQERFDEIVASLVEAEARDGASRPTAGDSSAAAPGSRGAALDSVSRSAGPRRRARSSAAAPLPASIDVDRASPRELERLPGIGPALAARIVAERGAHGPFNGPEGLLRVPGIGPKKLEKIRPYLSP